MTARYLLGKPLRTLVGGIRPRLFGMIMVAVVPLVGVHAIELWRERDAAITAAGARLLEIARYGGMLYEERLIAARTTLEVAAQVPDLVSGSAESCARFLERAGRDHRAADELWVFGRDGRPVCTTVPDSAGMDVSQRPYFRRVIETRQFVVSEFFFGKLRGEPTNVAAFPVLGPDGTVIRVLAVRLRLNWFAHLAEEIGATAGATVLLLDGNGTLVARYPARPDRIGSNFGSHELMSRMREEPRGWAEVKGVDGQRRIYGFVAIPATGARIAVGFDRAAVLARVDADISRAAIAVLVALILAMLTSMVLARGIARPLKLLTDGAEAVRRSQNADLPAISGYAEVESLAASLDELLADRKRREQALSAAQTEAESAEAQARTAHVRLLDALEVIPEGIVFFDAEDRYVLWNSRYAELYSESRDQLKPGLRFEDRLRAALSRGQYAEATGREEEWLAQRLALHAAPQSSHEQRLPGDRWVRVEERRTSDGGTIGIRVDITELKRAEESFRLLFESNPVPMWVCDTETLRILAVNDAAIAQYGYDEQQFLSMTILDIRPPEDHERVRQLIQQRVDNYANRVWRHLRADGREMLISVYSRTLVYDGRPALLAALIDITERMRAEERITHMAHHDALTDLANRTLFRERLEQALRRVQRRGNGLAVHCIDLDYFKNVNDTLGHPIGDALLKHVAVRLRECSREIDTVARIGGDEFAIIQEDIAQAEDAGTLAARLIEVLSEPYNVDGHEVVVAASVGIATAHDGERDPDRLLKNADVALYRAKAVGRRNYRFFEPEMDARLQARRMLELDLRAAYGRREFELHYQPSIDLDSNRASAFEALLRWNHAERGTVPPAEFIPIAEETGLINPLGEWVLRQACAEAVTWPDDIIVAVNLSPVQFMSGNLVQVVMLALAATGLPPRRLELEITESVLFQDNDVNLATLHQLRQLGVRIAMDDFGTGYSSLSYLRRFPFDRIKIDQSFVKELADNPDCLTITRGIIRLATGLGMKTTAEGVETAEQLDFLRAQGCTDAQGFLFGAARPAAEVHAFLARQQGAAEDAA